MAPIRPEFYYHPAVGVVSPTSLGLFAFKQGPLILSPENTPVPPKPLVRVTPPALEAASIASPVTPHVVEETRKMKKPARHDARNERCIVTGEEFPHTEMLRFVVDPQNNIVVDLAEKLPGEGFWIKADREIIKKAMWRNSFTTAARLAVNVPKNLLETVQIGLLRQSLETLALARKAGLLIQGFAKVEEVLQASDTGVYVVASDAKENGREKLEKLAGPDSVIDIWTSSQLSAALGEDNAVHVVLTPGGLTDKLLTIAHKLQSVN